jgi:hypothetical protein
LAGHSINWDESSLTRNLLDAKTVPIQQVVTNQSLASALRSAPHHDDSMKEAAAVRGHNAGATDYS